MTILSENPSDDLTDQEKDQYTELFIDRKRGLYIQKGCKSAGVKSGNENITTVCLE